MRVSALGFSESLRSLVVPDCAEVSGFRVNGLKVSSFGVLSDALKARAHANSDAVLGKYQPGSCASVGTDGNVTQAAGPY